MGLFVTRWKVARPALRCWRGREPCAGVKGDLGCPEVLTVVPPLVGGRESDFVVARRRRSERVLGSSGCFTLVACSSSSFVASPRKRCA
jgi:hypothetical protein